MLELHTFKGHGGKIHFCDICEKIFHHKQLIQQHIKKHLIGGDDFYPRDEIEVKLHEEIILKKSLENQK